MKTKEEFLKNIVIGNIVAFKNADNMYSGKVLDIEGDKYLIMTKNNSVYHIDKSQIVWVKNGTFWPEGIYNALKYTKTKEL